MARQRAPFERVRRWWLAASVSATLMLASAPIVVAQESTVSPAAEASAAPTATPRPQGFSSKMVKQVQALFDSTRRIRQLPSANGVTYRVIDDQAFRTELQAMVDAQYSADELVAEDDALTRLGFLGPDDDLRALMLKVYSSQVLAYYDPQAKVFSLIGPVKKIGPTESVVIAHEYDHALQDARWDLEGGRVKGLDQADAALAQQALVEGDATAVMYDWAARELKLAQLLTVSAQALVKQDTKLLNRLPPLLRRQLEFPYIDGFAFVNAIRGRGGWDAVDAVWEAQPVSTEQILHPELYPSDKPVAISLPDIAAALGADWTTRYQQTLGEMQIGVWVADGRKGRAIFPALPAQLPDQEAAAGWGGDRLVSLDGPDGAWAVVWQTDWDSKTDQGEFRKAARKAMKDLPGAHSATNEEVTGGLSFPVLVMVADRRQTLDELRVALGL
jgi:hypothetical protein